MNCKDNNNEETDLSSAAAKAILESIVSPTKVFKFQQVCNQNRHLFGSPGSALRRKIQRKHSYLSTLSSSAPEKFNSICNSFGIDRDHEEEEVSFRKEEQIGHREEIQFDTPLKMSGQLSAGK